MSAANFLVAHTPVWRGNYIFTWAVSLPEELIHQLTNTRNKTPFETSTKLLPVSALGCHPRGILEQRNIRPTR
jgi:hypothetical protein